MQKKECKNINKSVRILIINIVTILINNVQTCIFHTKRASLCQYKKFFQQKGCIFGLFVVILRAL